MFLYNRGNNVKSNIILIGFSENITKNVAKRLSLNLEMYYADVEDLMEYYLTSPEEEIENTCGKNYLDGLKANIMNEISNYENSIIYLPLSLFVNSNNADKLQTHGVITLLDGKDKFIEKLYKKSTDEERIDKLALYNRLKFARDNCDIDVVLGTGNEDKCYKKTRRAIKKYYINLLKRKK